MIELLRIVDRKVLIAVLLGTTLASGFLSWHEARWTPGTAVKPHLAANGSYRVGTVGDADGAAAVKAAVAALPVALAYDYRKLDASLTEAKALMTRSFAAEFTRTFEATTREMAVEKKAITSALVRGAGLVGNLGNGRATVLIYLDQVLVSSKDKNPNDPLRVSQNRVHVTVRKVGGAWKVDNIEPF